MLKILSTQLTGLFMNIKRKEEFHIEDGARLLAQAPIGEGKIYLKGFKEMKGIICEALEGAEPLANAKRLDAETELVHTDRVIIFTRFSNDEQAVQLGKRLSSKGIPFIAVSGGANEDGDCLLNIADIHINTHLVKPLLPTDDGERIGFPAPVPAFFIYYALKYTIDEILVEYE